jgi:N-acetylneuraminic acid mutarotase
LLLFGGDPGPNSNDVLPSLADSASILDVDDQTDPNWILEQQSWANEPSRRMHHSASSTGGKIWITGGEKVDGSNSAISQHEVFNPQSPTFTQLPSANGPPDIYGHTSIVLLNGSLVVFGGYSQSLASMIPFSTIWMLDTTSTNLQWVSLPVDTTNLPTPRRGFAAALLDSGMIIIHGGADAILQTTYSDGWILDTTRNPMVWSEVGQLSQLGARRDHMAVAIGTNVLFAFGTTSDVLFSFSIPYLVHRVQQQWASSCGLIVV